MFMSKEDRKKIHERLFFDGVLHAENNYDLEEHPDTKTRNLFVLMACKSLTSRGFLKSQFSWQHYYYTLTNEGVDYLREWLHLPAEIMPTTHMKSQRSHQPPRGLLGNDDRGERRGGFGGRGRGGDRGDRGDRGDGGYRRRGGEDGKDGGAPGGFAPEFRGGFGRGRGGAGGSEAPPS